MTLIKLLLFDDENEYSINLSNFLTHNFSEIFLVNYLSSSSDIMEWIKKIDPDIILTTENYYDQIPTVFTKKLFVLVSGLNTVDNKKAQVIYKYKDVNRIASDLINSFSPAGSPVSSEKIKKTKLTAVYSASGNAGKTTIAHAISNICSYSGLSVFYLNFEQFQSTGILFSGSNNNSISEIIYYVKERDSNLMSKIKTMSCTDSTSNIHYFKEADNAFTLNELLPEDIDFLLKAMFECGEYDLIVIDMDSPLNENAIKVFQMADEIIYIFVDEEICLHKTKFFIENLNLLSKNKGEYENLSSKFVYVKNKEVSKQALQYQNLFSSSKVISIPFLRNLFNSFTKINSFGGPDIINSFKEIAKRYISE